MLEIIFIGAAAGLIISGAVLFLAFRWFASSWRVVSDDELRGRADMATAWVRLLGWLKPGPRKLTYGRDKRGRFRRYRR